MSKNKTVKDPRVPPYMVSGQADECDPPKVAPPSPALMEAFERYDQMRTAVEGERRGSVQGTAPAVQTHVDIRLVWEQVDLSDGGKRSILTCIGGRYILWRDFLHTNRWRWALRDWPDDDRGTASHGAGTQHECVQACVFHFVEHNPGVEIPVK